MKEMKMEQKHFEEQNTIKILGLGENLTFKEIKEKDFQVEVVIPISFDILLCGDIDQINDEASKAITGSEVALNGIGYEVYNHFYNKDTIAIKVVGFVEDEETLSEMEGYIMEGKNE